MTIENRNGERTRVASAPVSFGVDEIIVDDAWMPGPDDMLDWMVDIGFEGTELGPPGFLGDATQLHERLSSRGLQLVGAFLPQHFSRDEKVQEDRAWLRDSLRLIREGAPDGSRTFAILCDHFDEPERLAFSGRIAEHPEAWLPPQRFESLVANLHRAAEICRRARAEQAKRGSLPAIAQPNQCDWPHITGPRHSPDMRGCGLTFAGRNGLVRPFRLQH